MPQRRRVQKGSFGSHFDELVKNFPHEPEKPDGEAREKRDRGDNDPKHINDRLFESAWRTLDDRSQSASS